MKYFSHNQSTIPCPIHLRNPMCALVTPFLTMSLWHQLANCISEAPDYGWGNHAEIPLA